MAPVSLPLWNGFVEMYLDRVAFEPNSGCWLWEGSTLWNGYGRICLNYLNHRVNHRVHRLSWEAEHGPIPDGLCVLHKCDVRTCLNPGHLFLGTRPENQADMAKKGRVMRGERHVCAKLVAEDVQAIRSDDRKLAVIAQEYGLHRVYVSKIKRRVVWRHLD